MTDDNRTSTQDQTAQNPAAQTSTELHDTGNGMSSHSQWTGDEPVSSGTSPASTPAVDAGTALGGNPTRHSDQSEQGVPQSVVDGSGQSETGTTFSTEPNTDKRL